MTVSVDMWSDYDVLIAFVAFIKVAKNKNKKLAKPRRFWIYDLHIASEVEKNLVLQ